MKYAVKSLVFITIPQLQCSVQLFVLPQDLQKERMKQIILVFPELAFSGRMG